jgi:hypothetical protein
MISMRVVAILGSLLFLFVSMTPAVASAKPGSERRSSHGISSPVSQKTNNREQPEQQPVEWNPTSCWDCTQPEEPEAFFFVGLFFTIPISVWVIRRRTRTRESLITKRVLEM